MQKQLKLIHLVILLCLFVFTFSTYSIAKEKDGLLKVWFLDVGQGDAIFIETPSGYQILVDGGPGNTVLSRLGEAMPFFDKNIDVIVMTHPDYDHASGLIEVLERYDVKTIVYSDIIIDKALYKSWEEAVAREEAKIVDPFAGMSLDVSDGVSLDFVYPLESLAGETIKEGKTNDASAVAILKYGELEILLTGDLETKGERALILSGIDIDIDADVLKVGHHGSKGSTSEEFISAVTPEVAVIQVGADNRYGHPANEVLERFDYYGIRTYRNDLDGTIKLISDGKYYELITQK